MCLLLSERNAGRIYEILAMKKLFTLVGAPGDVICGIGSAMLHSDFKSPADFLYIGYSEDVAEFVRAQSFCASCVSIIMTGSDYTAAEYALTRKLPPEQSCRAYLRTIGVDKIGISPDRVYLTHIGEQAKRDYRIHRWKNPQLPESVREWAKERFIDDGIRSYLLHPTSWQSNDLKKHWPHWTEAIVWLLQNYPQHRFYLTGQDYSHRFVSDNLVNLVDQTPTFMEVLAVSDLCHAVISTTNNLSHWCILTDKPSVACCVWGMSFPWYYFRKWIDVVPIRLVEFSDSLEVFKSQCRALFAETRFGPFAWKPENNPCTI